MTADILPMPKKPTRPIRAMVATYRRIHAEEFHEECEVPWPQMCGMITKAFEGHDPETGEEMFDYPTSESWERQIRGFFANPFAKSTGYSFALFLRQYGQYVIPKRFLTLETIEAKCGQIVPKRELATHERGCDKCCPPASPEVVREAMKAIEGLGRAWKA